MLLILLFLLYSIYLSTVKMFFKIVCFEFSILCCFPCLGLPIGCILLYHTSFNNSFLLHNVYNSLLIIIVTYIFIRSQAFQWIFGVWVIKCLCKQGFFKNSAGDLLPAPRFLGGLYNFCNFVIAFSFNVSHDDLWKSNIF